MPLVVGNHTFDGSHFRAPVRVRGGCLTLKNAEMGGNSVILLGPAASVEIHSVREGEPPVRVEWSTEQGDTSG